MIDPKGMTVLVTGATAGLGAATARRFAAAGCKLVLAGRRADRLEAMKKELNVPVHTLVLDVQKRKAVEAAIAGLPKEFAAIDVLVNNAGLALGLEPAHKADLDDWDTMVDTNVKGLVYVTRAVLPGMIERNKGHIINLGSTAGSYPYPGGNVYGASKAFVRHFSLNLRADIVGSRVRVTSLEPGLVETDFSLVRFKGDADKAAGIYKGVEAMQPEDIAETIFFVATLPERVNVNRIELMALMQASGPLVVKRDA